LAEPRPRPELAVDDAKPSTLDKQRIVAQGTHEQLLVISALYARLASQLATPGTQALAQAV
jgi:hypothetical protein